MEIQIELLSDVKIGDCRWPRWRVIASPPPRYLLSSTLILTSGWQAGFVEETRCFDLSNLSTSLQFIWWIYLKRTKEYRIYRICNSHGSGRSSECVRVNGIAAGGGFGFFSSSQKVHLKRWGGAVIGTTWENDIRHLCSLSIQLHLSGGKEHAVMARPPNE